MTTASPLLVFFTLGFHPNWTYIGRFQAFILLSRHTDRQSILSQQYSIVKNGQIYRNNRLNIPRSRRRKPIGSQA